MTQVQPRNRGAAGRGMAWAAAPAATRGAAEAQALNRAPDSIPALMKPGEFVLPPDTVAAVGGPKALQGVVDATHTPAPAVAVVPRGMKPELFFADGGLVGQPKEDYVATMLESARQITAADTAKGEVRMRAEAASAHAPAAPRPPSGEGNEVRSPVGMTVEAAQRAGLIGKQIGYDPAHDQRLTGTQGMGALMGSSASPAPTAPGGNVGGDVSINGQPPSGGYMAAGGSGARGMGSLVGTRPADASPAPNNWNDAIARVEAMGFKQNAPQPTAPGPAPTAQGMGAQPGSPAANATASKPSATVGNLPAPSQPTTPAAQPDQVLPGVYQHGRGQYSDQASGMGMSAVAATSVPPAAPVAAQPGTPAANTQPNAQNPALGGALPNPLAATGQVAPGVYQHGRGQYSDRASGMGMSAVFTGQPNAQNLQAAQALSDRSQQATSGGTPDDRRTSPVGMSVEQAQREGLVGAQVGYNPAYDQRLTGARGMGSVAGPGSGPVEPGSFTGGFSGVVGGGSGNMMSRTPEQQRRDAEVQSTSILKSTAERGRTALSGMDALDLQGRRNGGNLDVANVRENAGLQREGMQQQGENTRSRFQMAMADIRERRAAGQQATQNDLARQRLALDTARASRDGVPSGYRSKADGAGLEAIPGGPADPSIPKGKGTLNEGQAKALAFGARMQQSGQTLDALAASGVDQPGYIKRMADTVGVGALANWTQSPEQQQVEQGQRDFVNGVLRRESGAAISESEFSNARRQYFPQPGDSPAVIEQKRRNRDLSTRGVLAEVPDGQNRVQQVAGGTQDAAHGARLAELQRRAANSPALAARLREMGY